MTGITLTVDAHLVIETLNKLPRAADDPRSLLDDIGALLESH